MMWPMTMNLKHLPLFASLLLLSVCPARAELQDEIQVYDDAINARGETGLELHLNTTPRGRSHR